MHSQSPILKTKGAFSNPVILTYLWEQSCILHTLTKLPACNLEPKSVFIAWRQWTCIIPLELVGSVSAKVGSHKQVDLPIHRLQLWMLGCQLSHTHLSLITHTWPWFDLSRSSPPCESPAQSSSKLVWAWQIEYFECNLYVNTLDTSQKETCLVSIRFKSQLTMKLEEKPPKWVNVSSRVPVSKDQS